MPTYIIGDVHGCLDELKLLLEKINFNPAHDKLRFVGDLVNVNGNDQSMETLQFVEKLGKDVICVLGNHDLTLLGMACGRIVPDKDIDFNLQAILDYPNKEKLLNWLQSQPLIHYDQKFNILLVHAGLAPQWDIQKALNLAKEVEAILQNKQESLILFENMFGYNPDLWNDNLTGHERTKCIINYFTRLRFCSTDGRMDFITKGPAIAPPNNMMPWYAVPNRQNINTTIIFGHWAALLGTTLESNVIALDTGCVWGERLSALRLEDRCMFSVESKREKIFQ